MSCTCNCKSISPMEVLKNEHRVIEEVLDAVERMVRRFYDAEGFYFLAGACAQLGEREMAMTYWRQAVESGFLNYPAVGSDVWLQGLRGTQEFEDLVEHTRQRHVQAAAAFLDAGGASLLSLRGDP